ncbi:MAG: hypothetical protein RJA57_35 [Bacteroidota bacterium]|jgi:hypothetical protein
MIRIYLPFLLIALYVAIPASAVTPSDPGHLVQVQGNRNDQKVFLEWTVNENENIGFFEIERSTDGRTFTRAALVFGSDNRDQSTYRFFERNAKENTQYRIKMIGKDRLVEYSRILTL